MDRRHSKRVKGILMMLVISVIVISFCCFLDRDTVKVHADQIGDLEFFVGGEPISNGDRDPVPYTDESKIVRLLASAPVGSTYDWHINDPRIVSIKSGNGTDSVTFNINSPGYSGLTVTITTPDGSESKTFYCDIHVPLDWATSNLTSEETNYGYGLLYANNGDSKYTLQLYTENTSIAISSTKKYSHYLRKIKNINYYYKADVPETTGIIETMVSPARSDIAPDNLAPYTAALKWESSDYSVVDIDSNGVLLAKAAGFATVKVSTDTKSKYGEYDTLSFDVVVVPEVTKLSDSTGHAYTPDSTLSAGYTDYTKVVKGFNDSVMTIETNASKADMLDWHILRASGVSFNDITASMGSDIQISDVSGTIVISNLKAGVYYVTATPKKANGQGYDPLRSYITALKYNIIVPVSYPPDEITLGYYSEDFKDTFDLLEHSNIPTGMFEYEVPFNQQNVAKIGSAEGVVEAVSEGHASVNIKQLATAFNNYFGEYATH